MQNDKINPSSLTQGIGSYSDPDDDRSRRGSVPEESISIALKGIERPSCICEPTSPSRSGRYNFNRLIKDESPQHKIKPFSVSLSENCETPLPLGWQRRVHPEGLPYFFLPPSLHRPMRVVTEEWIYESELCALVQSAIKHIQNRISQIPDDHTLAWPDGDNDLCIEIRRGPDGKPLPDEDGTPVCGYYLVNHSKRTIYWAEEVTLNHELSYLLHNVRGKISEHQAEICLEAEYWANWDSFPALQDKNPETYEYAIETIVNVMTDIVSSDLSASGYKYEQLQRRLEIVKAAKECKSSNWHIGRFMKEIALERLRNYHGTGWARLSREQAVFESSELQEHSVLLAVISPLLFLIPHAQLQRVRMLIMDRTVVMTQWGKLFDQLQDEWNNAILIATIIVAANCAFLAIPLFQESQFVGTHSSPEQIASYLSLTTSLFGLILYIIMYRDYKAMKSRNPDELEHYIYGTIKDIRYSTTRIQHLLLVWSLPQALMIWSVITFFVAFLLMCFLGTLTVTKVTIGSATAFLGYFTLYYGLRFGNGRDLMQSWVTNLAQTLRHGRFRQDEQMDEESQGG